MTESTIYIQIPCSEGLPNEGKYFTNSGEKKCVNASGIGLYWDCKKDPKWYLKPVSSIKFASDFAEYCSENEWFYDYITNVWWMGDYVKLKSITTTELQQEFLKTYKG